MRPEATDKATKRHEPQNWAQRRQLAKTKLKTIHHRRTLWQRDSNQQPTLGRRKCASNARMNETPKQIERLRIRQQNVNKSLHATLDMLSRCAPDKYDIIAIQEPYIDFLGNMRAGPHWYSIYPKSHYMNAGKHTRSMILVSKRIATEAWEKSEIDSPDVTGLKIQTQTGVVQIFNVYCDCNHSDSITAIDRQLENQQWVINHQTCNIGMIWIGDFNWHHPIWDQETPTCSREQT